MSALFNIIDRNHLKEANSFSEELFGKPMEDLSPSENLKLFTAACTEGVFSVVKFCLEPEEPINIIPLSYVRSGFRQACINGHLYIVKWIHTVSTNLEGFRTACSFNKIDIIKHLLLINPEFYNDKLSFKYALNGGHLDLIKFLISKGADFHIFDFNDEIRYYQDVKANRYIFNLDKIYFRKYFDINENFHLACSEGNISMLKFLYYEVKGVDLRYNGDCFIIEVYNTHPKLSDWLISLDREYYEKFIAEQYNDD